MSRLLKTGGFVKVLKTSCEKIDRSYAIIAGGGDLPKVIYDHCISRNIDCHVVMLRGECDQRLFQGVTKSSFLPYKISNIIDCLRKHHIKNVFLAGKVKRINLLKAAIDWQGRKLLAAIARDGFNDRSVFNVVVDFFEKNDFNVLPYDFITQKHVATGSINNIAVHSSFMNEIVRGTEIMRGISKYDIGQALVIENSLVIGVEGIEGTDELIRRCAKLQQQKRQAILVKICKENQDQRVDLPCIGPVTIKNIAKYGYAGIVFEAKKTVLLHVERCCKIADKNKIFVYGI